MNNVRRTIGLLMLVMMGACSTADTLSRDDNGRQVALNTGDEIELVLAGNPSTGFTWIVTEAPSILDEVGETEYVPQSDRLGAGGEFHFRFVATGPGTGQLVLVYERPFEEVEPADAFEIDVTVDDR